MPRELPAESPSRRICGGRGLEKAPEGDFYVRSGPGTVAARGRRCGEVRRHAVPLSVIFQRLLETPSGSPAAIGIPREFQKRPVARHPDARS